MHAHSPWSQTPSGSTEPAAQLETLTEETTRFHLGIIYLHETDEGNRIFQTVKFTFWNENFISFKRIFSNFLLTNTSIPVQHKTGFARTFEAAQCVQTISILTDTLHGALVDIFKVRKCGVKMRNFMLLM